MTREEWHALVSPVCHMQLRAHGSEVYIASYGRSVPKLGYFPRKWHKMILIWEKNDRKVSKLYEKWDTWRYLIFWCSFAEVSIKRPWNYGLIDIYGVFFTWVYGTIKRFIRFILFLWLKYARNARFLIWEKTEQIDEFRSTDVWSVAICFEEKSGLINQIWRTRNYFINILSVNRLLLNYQKITRYQFARFIDDWLLSLKKK